MKLSAEDCPRTSLMIRTLVQVMAPCIRQQDITWTSVHQDLRCHMGSLGHNELSKRENICPSPFPKEKRGDYGLRRCHNSVTTGLISILKLCRHCNSAPTGPIRSKSNSSEPSWPVDVQHHGHFCPSGPHGHNKGSGILADARTQQPLGGLTPKHIHWKRLGL